MVLFLSNSSPCAPGSTPPLRDNKNQAIFPSYDEKLQTRDESWHVIDLIILAPPICQEFTTRSLHPQKLKLYVSAITALLLEKEKTVERRRVKGRVWHLLRARVWRPALIIWRMQIRSWGVTTVSRRMFSDGRKLRTIPHSQKQVHVYRRESPITIVYSHETPFQAFHCSSSMRSVFHHIIFFTFLL